MCPTSRVRARFWRSLAPAGWRTTPVSSTSQQSGYYGNAEIAVRFHNTIIVRYYANDIIELNSGGYHTATTKQRINQLLLGTPDSGATDIKYRMDNGKWELL